MINLDRIEHKVDMVAQLLRISSELLENDQPTAASVVCKNAVTRMDDLLLVLKEERENKV